MLCSEGLLPDPTFTRHACAAVEEISLILILPFPGYRSGAASPHSHKGGRDQWAEIRPRASRAMQS
eukprot:3893492-Pyramimonas_sp.AAC.1